MIKEIINIPIITPLIVEREALDTKDFSLNQKIYSRLICEVVLKAEH